MNYLLSVLFLIFIFLLYNSFGALFLKIFKIKNNLFAFKIIIGYLFTYFLGFLVGLPMQILSVSWYLFATTYAIVLLLMIIFLFFKGTKKVIELNNIKKQVLKHFKMYWLVYLFVILFSLLSITNTQPYYLNNYNDDYYITKVVHLIGTPHLLNENYSYGYVLNFKNILDNAHFQGYRAFNTYELVYSCFSSYFRISPAFFCRFTMVIHNYYLVFMLYTLFAGLFLEENLSQYALLLFPALMIPSGFASRGLKIFKIRMYENWRFQTAIFYGGSVTRVCSLPLFLYFGNHLVIDFSLKKLLCYLMVFISLLSFQTNACCYFIICSIILILIRFYNFICSNSSNNKQLTCKLIIYFSTVIMLLVSTDYLLRKYTLVPFEIQKNSRSYELYYANMFTYDFFALSGFISILFLIVNKKVKNKGIMIGILILFLLFRLNKSSYIINLISFNSYGGARILTSVLLLCIICNGILLIVMLRSLHAPLATYKLLSSILAITVFVGIYANNTILKKYNKVEDNMTNIGYSIKPIIDNDKMLPDMIAAVGNYFNELPYKKYRIMSEYMIPYDHTRIDSHSLLYSSNRLELYYFLSNENTENIKSYLEGNVRYDNILGILKVSKCNYILTTREKIKDDLSSHGWVVKTHCNKKYKNFYLMYKDTSRIKI